MNVVYELRTRTGRPVWVFDQLAVALRKKSANENRIGVPLRLFRITTIEEDITP